MGPSEHHVQSAVSLLTYNELANLPSLVRHIRDELPEVAVLVVDDNSPDGTGQWCRDYERQDPLFLFLHRPVKEGIGAAALAALRFAIEAGFETVVTMDADGSHDPRHIRALLAILEERMADVVVGSRYVAGGKIVNWQLSRRFASRLVNLVTRVMFRIPIHDCSSGFRAYRTAALEQLDFKLFAGRGYAFYEEILWRLRVHGARMVEVPITFTERHAGVSKATIPECLRAIGTLVRLGLTRKSRGCTGFRPVPKFLKSRVRPHAANRPLAKTTSASILEFG